MITDIGNKELNNSFEKTAAVNIMKVPGHDIVIYANHGEDLTPHVHIGRHGRHSDNEEGYVSTNGLTSEFEHATEKWYTGKEQKAIIGCIKQFKDVYNKLYNQAKLKGIPLSKEYLQDIIRM